MHVGPLDALPFEPDAFDVVVVHGGSGFLTALTPEARTAALREWHRVLRTGGRIVIIESGTPVGLSSFFRSSASTPTLPRPARRA